MLEISNRMRQTSAIKTFFFHHLIIYDFLSIIISDSDHLAPEIVESLSQAEEDHDYDYT